MTLSITTKVAEIVWGFALSCWRSIVFFFLILTNIIETFCQSCWGLHIIHGVDFHTFDYVFLVDDASVVPENVKHHFPAEDWVLEFLFSGKRGDNIQLTGLSIEVTVIHPTLVPWDNAVWKIITLTFAGSRKLLTCSHLCSLHFRCAMTWHPPSTHLFCDPNPQQPQWH